MSEDHEPSEQPAPEAPTVERDNTRTTFIFLVVVGSCLVLGGLVVAVDQFFGFSVQDEIARKLLQPESSLLRKLRADEEAKLTSYRWVDQAKGVVQIPVRRAMELVASEWASRPAGYVPGTAQASTPVAAPAAATSPSPGAAPDAAPGTPPTGGK